MIWRITTFARYFLVFLKENFPKILQLVDRISELARKTKVQPSQLTLAWLLAQGPDIFPIPGTTDVERLKENMDSMFVQLSTKEVNEFRRAVEEANVHGIRCPESLTDCIHCWL